MSNGGASAAVAVSMRAERRIVEHLRGAGATRSVLCVTLLGTLLVRLPLGYLLAVPGGLGLFGVWLACLCDWVLEAAVLSLIVRRESWKTQTV